jgi:NADPH:quinone reductase-like Zn-dependent oxidoreductase
MEFAGTVVELGDGVDRPAVGSAVFGVVGGGAQAEMVVVPAGQCATVPAGLDLTAMGGVPEAFVTAHDAMCTQAQAAAGEWVLIHAVGSGVGTAALQLAKAIGARVIGTSRSGEKLEQCRPLGLDHGIVPPVSSDGSLDATALAAEITRLTDGGIDVVIDLVTGSYVDANVAAAAPGGRIVLVGTLAGGSATLQILTVMQRRLRLFGTVLRTRTAAEKAAATDLFSRDVVPFLADGTIAPVIDAVMPLAEASDAYDRLASDTTFGKIVLSAD